MSRILIFSAAAFAFLRLAAESALAPVGDKVRLASMEEYAIVLPEARNPQSVRGAIRLAEAIGNICGIVPPVTNEAAFCGGPAFYVGQTAASDVKGLKGPDSLEGYRIAVYGVDVFLLGNKRGPAQAVLALLEEDWGVRWFAASAPVHYPQCAPNDFTVTPREYVPPFMFRSLINPAVMNGAWAAFNRYQPSDYFTKTAFADGGSLANEHYFCHTYCAMIPAKRFFSPHPEYFPLRKGKRYPSTSAHGQLCYTCPALEDELVRQYETAMEKRPESILYACAANDNLDLGCECPGCAALIAAEGYCGIQLDLANRVAARLAEKNPDVFVKTTAYVETQDPPPTIRPGMNVIVEYCPIRERAGTDMYRPWRSHRKIRGQFDAWRKATENLCVWDYALDWDMTPMPNFETALDNLRFWRDCGVKGVLIQETETGRVNLQELRAWLFAKLMWNPTLDLERLVSEFMSGHYGKAGEKMMEYWRCQMSIYRGFKRTDRPGSRASLRFDKEAISAMRSALRSAWAATEGDETLRARIAQEICAFLALPLAGCPKGEADWYRRNLELAKKLSSRYEIAFSRVNEPKIPVATRNRSRISRWENILAKASTRNPLPTYCGNSITLSEKRPWYQCKTVEDEGALAPGPVRHPHAGGWLTQWDYSELVATAPNQTVYVVRVRVKGDLLGSHRADAPAMAFGIYRAGDDVSPVAKIKFGDLPANGAWGFCDIARIHLYTVSPKGYFYCSDSGLGEGEAILFDYLEFIPEEDFGDKVTLARLPVLVL